MSEPSQSIDRGSAVIPVASDPRLSAELKRYGWFDATGCYQCGSCTLSCDLARDAGFPRRTLRLALLGLREPLRASLEPWLCQDCGDCSKACPREDEPRRSVATLRRWLVGQYDWTGLSARILRSKVWYLGAMAVVALAVLGLILAQHLWRTGMAMGDFAYTSMGLSHMFPTMTWFTLVVTVVPLLLLVTQALRLWHLAMRGTPAPARLYIAELRTFFVELVTQARMRDCPEARHRRRWLGHLGLALGTVIMLVLVIFFLRWFQTDAVHPPWHPQRWIGYLATALMLHGSGDVLVSRLRGQWENHKHSELSDVMLPLLLFLTALTGIAVHVLRYAGAELGAHWCFALHIVVTTPMLVVEIPFGKWSHMIYRPMALYLRAVRERVAAEATAGEAVAQHA